MHDQRAQVSIPLLVYLSEVFAAVRRKASMSGLHTKESEAETDLIDNALISISSKCESIVENAPHASESWHVSCLGKNSDRSPPFDIC